MDKLNISFDFIKSLKQQILASRYVVAKIANAESLRLYYNIGEMIDKEFEKNKWGAKVSDEIASLLQQELPGLRGFSGSNIRKMRMFYQNWNTDSLICSTLSNKLEIDGEENYSSLTSEIQGAYKQTDTIGSLATTKFEHANNNAFLSVSFSHHFEIIVKTETEEERWYYIYKTAKNFWSVRHLRTELGSCV